MKGLNVLGGLVVLCCNLIVSYNHTIALFHKGGFTGWMAHIGTIAVEVTFIMGALNLVSSRMRGISPGLPAVAGFIFGVLLVSWSNTAAGWAHGITGVLLGLATPISLIIAESILSRAILQRKKAATKDMKETVQQVEKTHVTHPNTLEVQSPEAIAQTTKLEVKPTDKVQPTTQSIKSEDEELNKKTTKTTQENPTEKITTVESPTKLTMVGRKPTTDEAHPLDVAMQLYKQDGKLPSRRSLAKLAKITEYKANQVIQQLKEQTS